MTITQIPAPLKRPHTTTCPRCGASATAARCAQQLARLLNLVHPALWPGHEEAKVLHAAIAEELRRVEASI